jgi:hypothetical protein
MPKPDFLLGASGGCIASYILLGADFSEPGIERICRQINSTLLTTTWFPSYLNFLPSAIIGIFKGAIYQKSTGSLRLIERMFTPYNISRIEILTGTTERKTGKSQIFSNRDEKDSIMNGIPFDHKLNNSLPIIYNAGDVKEIAKVCTASASVPIIVPDEQIDGKYYIDGGTTYSSPLSPLEESLDFVGNKKPLHLTYFNYYDIECPLIDETYYNLIQNTDSTIARIIKSLSVQDRNKGIDFVKKVVYRKKYNLLYFEGQCDQDVLKSIEQVRLKSKRSFLELYTSLIFKIEITDFNYKDIMDVINKVKKNYSFRFWVAADSKNAENIKKILEKYIDKRERSVVNSVDSDDVPE